jgi:hypothetical protein
MLLAHSTHATSCRTKKKVSPDEPPAAISAVQETQTCVQKSPPGDGQITHEVGLGKLLLARKSVGLDSVQQTILLTRQLFQQSRVTRYKEMEMKQLRLILCEVVDQDPDKMRELACFDVPNTPVDALCPQTAVDTLEQQTFEIGNSLLKKLMQAQWEQVDAQLTQKARRDFPPSAGQKRRK